MYYTTHTHTFCNTAAGHIEYKFNSVWCNFYLSIIMHNEFLNVSQLTQEKSSIYNIYIYTVEVGILTISN